MNVVLSRRLKLLQTMKEWEDESPYITKSPLINPCTDRKKNECLCNWKHLEVHGRCSVKFESNDRYLCIRKTILNEDDLLALDIISSVFELQPYKKTDLGENWFCCLRLTSIMHQVYSLYHRKPPPKFEIEALFRLVILYTDTKKSHIIVLKFVYSLPFLMETVWDPPAIIFFLFTVHYLLQKQEFSPKHSILGLLLTTLFSASQRSC
ncbi:hypothetical protein AGLY_001078 [Aphis glycines]|uniref:Uncharacterized protein n=1 Tax=Aphis glycines TaxID=307491 RepID=A0A6G0U8S3_APHGL|nr:hypothetical protein AGLY_001078 [Aphis glycines]